MITPKNLKMFELKSLACLREAGRFVESKRREALRHPYEIKESEWINDLTVCPPVELEDIHAYLVETPGQFTNERMKLYKSLDAFNYSIR